ncbi:MAG: hypothetical protein U0Z17_01820 [Bacteroidales bacterium]
MHPSAIREFHNRYGYNLKDIFNPGSSSYWKNNLKVKADVPVTGLTKWLNFTKLCWEN